MRSKPFMASATDIANSETRGRNKPMRFTFGGSRLGRTIIALNALGLVILIGGALILNETRRALVASQLEALSTEGETIANLIAEAATVGEPEPALDAEIVGQFLLLLPLPSSQRLRIYDAQGNLIADSYYAGDRIERRNLPRLRGPGGVFQLEPAPLAKDERPRNVARARAALEAEASRALRGERSAGPRPTSSGERVLSVSIPLHRVQAVTGVLVLEAGDVDEIIRRERIALIPFIVIAILAVVASSILLNFVIADPVRRLARAADQVRLSRARAISLPEISRRNDELGDLSRSLETMTDALSERMDAIERFAADVTHEIRNPLTSIRSAVETLDLISEPKARDRLLGILKQDVGRLDRLITDISNASRLDAELSRDAPRAIEIDKLIADIVDLYAASAKPGEPAVLFERPDEPLFVSGREVPLGQVLRNLIDNARSFTGQTDTAGASVRVSVRRVGDEVMTTVDDDGPGIPEENLETVFERFYTSRPKSAGTGGWAGNSGLGLAIARQITVAHNGRIWAANRKDDAGQIVGARFVIALPAAGARTP